MKRVIDGKTCNTDTAAVVAQWKYAGRWGGPDTTATLYQTRSGAFFAVHNQGTKTSVETMTRDEVHRLVEHTDNLEIATGGALDEPPEAKDEPTRGAVLFVRLHASLKKQIAAAANRAGLSANTWAMRCLEGGIVAVEPVPGSRTPAPSLPPVDVA